MKSRKIRVKVMLALVVLLWGNAAIYPRAAQAQPLCPTGSGGVISSDQAWSTSCNVTDDVTVDANATLTISPGVVISITSLHTVLYINGRLDAQGTSENRIRFTSGDAAPKKGDWGRIIFNPSSTNNILEYMTFEYGGGSGFPSVEVKTDALTMNNVEIRNGSGDGMRVIDSSPSISNTTFSNNDGDALDLRDLSFPLLSDLIALNNGYNGVALTSTNDSITIASDYTWGTGLQNYRLSGSLDVTVAAGATLTIMPNTTIRMGNNNSGIYVDGSLKAQGTAANPILITSGADSPRAAIGEKLYLTRAAAITSWSMLPLNMGAAPFQLENPV